VRTVAQRNLDAEVRGVEAGHRALAQPDGSIRVVSDTHHDKHYVVTFTAPFAGSAVVFTCAPHGTAAYRDDHLHTVGGPGLTPCMHAALAARRLEREGLVRFTGAEWVATDKAAAPAPTDDPFATFR
jgi:hypothetical protein